MKKNKLYTANRWNQPAFMPERNLFPDGGSTNPLGGLNPSQMSALKEFNLSANIGTPKIDWSNPVQRNMALGQTKALTSSFGSGNPINLQQSNQMLSNTIAGKTGSSFGGGLFSKGGAGWGMAGAAAGILGSVKTGDPRGMWDTLDPVYHLAGGRESGAGNAMSDAGVSLTQAGLSSGQPYLALAGAGLKVIGGLTNAAFGIKENTALKKEVEEGINRNKNFVSNASSFDDVKGPVAATTNTNVYEGGWFSGGKAREKNEELKRRMIDARQWAFRGVDNNIFNLQQDQMNNALANYSAFGGPIETGDMGAIDYGFMTDYLTQKKRENDMKSKTGGITPMPAFMPNSYAIGGNLQTNGADWSDGLVTIGAGSQHETNPNEGVQLGVDNEGTPNLVEEGETIWNDYVFSARIPIDDTTKEMFHIGKKREMTYADLSKKLEKEIAERVNDPISKAGFERQMQMLEEQQERQKQEMEAERAKAAFEALSPEEQTALMQQRAEQEAMAQQAIAEQQAAMQQPSQEEMLLAQQQQQMADGSEAALGQEPQMAANGGKINRFDEGGRAYTKMLNSLGFHTQKEFDDWAKENNIDLSKIWSSDNRTLSNDILSNLWKDENFKNALKAKNPALAHAFSEKGYDWGAYQPIGNGKATIQSISKGNWKTTNGKGWRGSDDLAFKQATEGLSDAEIDALTTEQLAERMRKTAAYQNTNKWLQNSDNALQYLNTLLNDPNTPEVAREYARKFVKDGKWKEGFNYDYATVFGSNGKGVRETNPGTYWHTALEANRGNQTGNFVINEDGTIEPILGDVPTDWASAGNYAWSDEDNDYTYNYYKRPVVSALSTQPTAENETSEETKNKGVIPDLKKETYFGLFGPAIGLGLMGLGVGKPDVASYDAATSSAGNYTTANWKPLGNYLTYRPLDIWYGQNALNAQSRATDRALMNTSGGNRGTAMAGLLANGYNSQLASGNLFRQAQEYNDALRQKVEDFNRGTDQFNSEQYGATSRFNADAYNNASRASAQMKLHAAQAKDDANRWWASNLYGNINGLFDNINQWEKWKRDHNSVARMAANGVFGVGTEDTPVFGGYVEEDKKGKRSASNGGKLKKKKRGLTI